jgi:hypothetical protein
MPLVATGVGLGFAPFSAAAAGPAKKAAVSSSAHALFDANFISLPFVFCFRTYRRVRGYRVPQSGEGICQPVPAQGETENAGAGLDWSGINWLG